MYKIRVLIADDHTIVREGIKRLANTQPDVEIVGEAEDGMEVMEKARSLRPDVVLLDIGMPKINGLEAIQLIKEAVPDTQIVVISAHTQENYVHQALSSGALGYVPKAAPGSDIFKAIRAAYRKVYFLSSRVEADVISSYLKGRQRQTAVRGYGLLTEREKQVFHLAVGGSSNNQIADLLCVSVKTADRHRSNVMKKLGVHGFPGLVKHAVKLGIPDHKLWRE
jgi:two-component system, NarL family, response regulator NreC